MSSKKRMTPARREGKRRTRARKRLKAKLLQVEWMRANGPCKQCGSIDRLEIDHIVPLIKKHQNSKIFMRSPEAQTRELSMCQVLCRSCHRQKSGLERRKYDHGLNLYERHGCRCDVCRSAHAAKLRKTRRRKHATGVPWSQIS